MPLFKLTEKAYNFSTIIVHIASGRATLTWWSSIRPPCEDEPTAASAVGSSVVWSVWWFALSAFLVFPVVSVRPRAKVPLCTVTIRTHSRHDRSSHWPSQGYTPFPSGWLCSIPDEPNRNCTCTQSGTCRCATPASAKPRADSCE